MEKKVKHAVLQQIKDDGKRKASEAGLKYKTYRKLTVPGVLYGHLVELAKNRGKRSGVEVTITADDIRKLWKKQEGKCALTGVELKYIPQGAGNFTMTNPYGPTIDRIDRHKGYTPDNIRLLSFWANNSVYTFGEEIFNEMCELSVKWRKK